MSDDGLMPENQNVIPLRAGLWDGIPLELTADRILRIKQRMVDIGMGQAKLSNATGLSGSAISQILSAKFKTSRHLPVIAKALKVNISWLLAETDQQIDLACETGGMVSQDHLPMLLSDTKFAKSKVKTVKTEGVLAHQFERKWDAVTVAEIDLIQSGGSSINGIPVRLHGHIFSGAVLRACAGGDGAGMMVAQGIGDAMNPALTNSDYVFFDTSQRVLDCLDMIWLVRYAGMLTVRRVRKTADGYRLMADNPLLTDIIAGDGDVDILGKVTGLIRRI